jgi:3-isopropylmalate/(R)-2-methylmalate dehydratase small subunit
MRKFTIVEAVAVPMPDDNIDTDQIIPARFLRKPRKDGYQDFLFHDSRFRSDGSANSDYVLNLERYRSAEIIVAGKNFACGSSREGAVYALADYGIRSIIAPSFSDIFFNNALINGLLPVRLTEDEVSDILGWIDSTTANSVIRVDLVKEEILAGDKTYRFSVSGLKRRCMLEGLDEISLTRTYADQIEEFERGHRDAMPWLIRANDKKARQ